jgi:Amt family ammonium transporter
MATVGTLIIASIIKAVMGLRANQDEEESGLDLTQHGEVGYTGPATGAEPIGIGHGAPVAHAAPAAPLHPETAR